MTAGRGPPVDVAQKPVPPSHSGTTLALGIPPGSGAYRYHAAGSADTERADRATNLTNLHDRDTSLAFVSRASTQEVEAAKQARGWTMPWYSLEGDSFSVATGYAGVAQLSVFIHDDDSVFLTYVTRQGRDLETISNHWTFLERTPAGP